MCRWTVQEAIGRPHAGLPCTVFLAPFISHCSPLVARTLLTPSVRLPAANMAAHLCASSKAAVMGRRQPFVAAAGAAARSVRPLQVVAAKPAKAAEFRCAARPKMSWGEIGTPCGGSWWRNSSGGAGGRERAQGSGSASLHRPHVPCRDLSSEQIDKRVAELQKEKFALRIKFAKREVRLAPTRPCGWPSLAATRLAGWWPWLWEEP